MPGVCIYQRFMPPDPSGAGKQALTMARVVRDAGWDVVLLTDHQAGTQPSPRIEDFPVVQVAAPAPNPSYPQILRYWSRVGRALLKLRNRFDVLHVHSADFHQIGAIPIAKLLGKRTIVRSSISREFSALGASRSGRLHRRLLRMVDAFVVLSQRLKTEYRIAGLPMSKLNLIPNGVDTGRYHPVGIEEKRALRQELGLAVDGRILVFHGVFLERKALHWLVEVLQDRLEALGLTLLLVGGPARDEQRSGYARRLQSQIERSPANSRIIIRGHDPAVHRYLKAADAYVLASTGEGLPNALLEAMAVGLVPFASRTSGSEDVIEEDVSGFLFEPGDSRSLLHALDCAFGPSASVDMAAVGAAAAARIRDCFSIRATARQYVALYERLTG